jgi:hypothetical protein
MKPRYQIQRFAAMLEVVIKSLRYARKGESAGWHCDFARKNHDESLDAWGWDADELCRGMLVSVRLVDMSDYQQACIKIGAVNAAKIKDAEIQDLQRRLATGNSAYAAKVINGLQVSGIRNLLRAMWKSGECEPPMRDLWVLQELMDRHCGKQWRADDTYVPPETPIRFEPIPKEERRRFHDASPWLDLEAIRKAAGTQDTETIVAMVSPTAGTGAIAAERMRQIQQEGWDAKHDDHCHTDGALAVVAAALAVDATDADIDDPLDRVTGGKDCFGLVAKHGVHGVRPNRIRALTIAGSLIAAEIDRLQRQAAQPTS